MTRTVSTHGLKCRSFWEDTVDCFQRDARDLPSHADVVIVGGGYTGLVAAAELARAGKNVALLDAHEIGHGCSSRNGGQVSATIKPGFNELVKKFGPDRAREIKQIGVAAFENLKALIASENLDADWQETGRFLAAHSQQHLDKTAAELAGLPQGLEIPHKTVTRAELPEYLGQSSYVGGVFFPLAAGVNPAKLLQALARRASDAGAELYPNSPVQKVSRSGDAYVVETPLGQIRAARILVATNGYSGKSDPWCRRRIIPIASSMIATQELDPTLVASLIPKARQVIDTRKLVVYFRPSPDGRRILFGGRAGLFELPAEKAAQRLLGMLNQSFPKLSDIRAEYCWSGTVGYTFDKLPHIGANDGIHYAMGYCGSGVAMSVYLGQKAALQLLGRPEGRTPLDGISFPTRPFYTGFPWFLVPAIAAMRTVDRHPFLERLAKV